ncbi:MAG TPA: hypothetical protein VHY58_06625 [Streptosporangiaceae bacterium]|nr:hypothetical protein [Streptosporangiaceae bacterium]
MPEQVPEGGAQVWVPKVVPGLLQPAGLDALAGQGQFPGALAPDPSRGPTAGIGSRAGRRSVAARARVYSVLRTGLGATALTGPVRASSHTARR